MSRLGTTRKRWRLPCILTTSGVPKMDIYDITYCNVHIKPRKIFFIEKGGYILLTALHCTAHIRLSFGNL